MWLGACRPPETPESVYAAIERTFVAGDLASARAQAADALKRFGDRGPWAGRFRVELAKISLYQGDSSASAGILATPIEDAAPDVAVRQHTILSLALARTGDTVGAERELARALAVGKANPRGGLDAEVASACGSLHLEHGDFENAERMFGVALLGARQRGDTFLEASMLLNLGVVGLQQERYEEALTRFNDAQAAASRMGARYLEEKIAGNRGSALYGLGDFPGARESFRLAQRQAEVVDVPIDHIEWLNDEGQSEFRMGDVAAAQRAYRASLREAESIHMQEEIADAHAALGLLLLETDARSAAQHIAEFGRISQLRRNRPDTLNADLLEAMLWARTGEPERAAERLATLDGDKDLAPSLHWQAEQELARVNVRLGNDAEAERWFRRAIETFHRQRLSLEQIESTLPFLENGTDLYSDYVQFLVNRGRTDDALTVVDQSRAEALRGGLPGERAGRPVTKTGEADRRRLAADLHGAILVYSVLPHESYLWVTTPARSAFFRVAGGADLRSLIEAHRRAILGSKDLLAISQPTGRALFRKLLEPAAAMLRPGERVFLVSDGALNELNFETLVHGDETGRPHFWIDDVVLTQVPSLGLLRPAGQEAGRAGGRILLMGDPQYRAQEYQALPKAAEEVQDVVQHFAPENRTVLTGASATPAAYRKQRPGDFRYIHFVAHSTANTLRPLDSAVVLSRGGDGGDKLYAREIVSDPLRAELVTISGCYSSGARVYAGEGAVGLAWAFERAGARHVIGTLWEVNDASTPELMDRLYAGLLRGTAPDVALRDAKLELLHAPGVFRKPLYWAPFQLYSR